MNDLYFCDEKIKFQETQRSVRVVLEEIKFQEAE